jgi:hypothetical protein
LAADPKEAVTGTIVDIEHDLARVLIGDDEEEWFFPMQTLPEGSEVGSVIMFAKDEGRYTALSASRARSSSIDNRLTNPLLLRKTADFRVSDLRRELEDDE